MSNTSIMSVREMIENAFGETDVNTVNFKLIQAILYLLARQLRVLERQVGVEIGFVPAAEKTESTLSVTEVNIAATVPRRIKGKGASLLSRVLTSTPKVTQSTMGGGSSVFERMSRISRVSAYDVQTSRRRAEESAGKGGQRKSINESDTHHKRKESSSKYTDDSRSSKRGKSESEKDRYGDESDISDQFHDSREKGRGKTEKIDKDKHKRESVKASVVGKGRSGKASSKSGGRGTGVRAAEAKSDTEDSDEAGETERTGGARSKGRPAKQSSGRAKKIEGVSSSSSNGVPKLKTLQKILNAIEEQRERVLRVIQQRTDSKVEGAESPSPIASMESTEIQYEKLLILERVPSKDAQSKSKKRTMTQPQLSIVTHEQFDELVKQVEILEKKFGQASFAEYGENAQLMEELRKGASLTDAMAALQLSARIETSEKALQNMITLLTELAKRGPPKQGITKPQGGKAEDLSQTAAKGAGKGKSDSRAQKGRWQLQDGLGHELEEDMDLEVGSFIDKTKQKQAKRKDDKLQDSLTQIIYEGPRDAEKTAMRLPAKDRTGKDRTGDHDSVGFTDIYGRTAPGSLAQTKQGETDEEKKYGNFITPEQLQLAMTDLHVEFTKTMKSVMGKSSFNAENAMKICKAIENQLMRSGNIHDRMGALEISVADYIEQINILDTGLSSQMTNYQEQLTQMQHELEIGLENMAEALAAQGGDSEAVTELNTRLTALQADFDKAKYMQLELSDVQTGLGLDLEALWKQIEVLRGIKSDRDEVADALRDKAGIGILNGLVSVSQFEAVRGDLDKRIRAAYDKFNNQEMAWQKAIDDLTREINEKAEYSQVMALRDDVNKHLEMLRRRVENMLDLLGEPKVDDMPKTIYRDGPCLSCATPSPFGSEEPNLDQLPPIKVRPPTIGEEAPSKRKGEGDYGACYFGQPIPHSLDPRARICTRYCGSSVPPSTKLLKEPVNININALVRQPTLGSDGKVLSVVPCAPCNTSAMLNAVKLHQEEKSAENTEETVKNREIDERFDSMQTPLGNISI